MKPNLIVAGTNKSGTTALFRYLAAHHDICSSSIKETCYFLPLRYNKPIDPVETYLQYFAQHDDQSIVLESTPGYFYGGSAIANEIAKTLPGVRVVLVFRDPVTRFRSFFNFMKWMQKIDVGMTASEYLDACLAFSREDFKDETNAPFFGFEGGQYHHYLAPWIDTFGDRLRITFFENLTNDPRVYLRNLADFMEIDANPFDNMSFAHENRTRRFSNAKLHALALKTYKLIGPVINRNPAIKRLALSAYNSINETAIDRQSVDTLMIEKQLKLLYQDSIERFHNQISVLPEGIVMGPLPAWQKRKI